MSDMIFLEDPGHHYRRVARPAGAIPPLPAYARGPEVKRVPRPTPGLYGRYCVSDNCRTHPWCRSRIDAPMVLLNTGEWLTEREWLYQQGIIALLSDRERGAILPQRVEYDDTEPEPEMIV